MASKTKRISGRNVDVLECFNLNDYKFKTSRYIIVNIYKPHGNYKSKTYKRYTKTRKKSQACH